MNVLQSDLILIYQQQQQSCSQISSLDTGPEASLEPGHAVTRVKLKRFDRRTAVVVIVFVVTVMSFLHHQVSSLYAGPEAPLEPGHAMRRVKLEGFDRCTARQQLEVPHQHRHCHLEDEDDDDDDDDEDDGDDHDHDDSTPGGKVTLV